MAYHFGDNVHVKTFTPKDPNIELLHSAFKKNIAICLSTSSGKSFVAHKLIQHVYNKDDLKPGTIAVYISDSQSVVKNQGDFIKRLTNLSVAEFDNSDLGKSEMEWKESLKDDVLVMTSQVAVMLFSEKLLDMSNINLLILHGCHCVVRDGPSPMKEIMKFYFECTSKPQLLGLANSLFVSKIEHRQMEAGIRKMEDSLNCDVETASSAVSGLRYNAKPQEVVLEFGEREKCDLDELIEKEVYSAIDFLSDHQFNLNEMYEGYVDDLRIPDPALEPKHVLMELLQVYKTLGPWSAERAALVFLMHIERLKITTPYERHFLLLCMTFTVLLKIRAMLSNFFENISDRDRIYKYTSPKILRLIEVLRKFQPEKCFPDFYDSSESDENEIPEKLNPDVAQVDSIDFEKESINTEIKDTISSCCESNDPKKEDINAELKDTTSSCCESDDPKKEDINAELKDTTSSCCESDDPKKEDINAELKDTTSSFCESNVTKSITETELLNEDFNIKLKSLSLTKENEIPGDILRNGTNADCNEHVFKDSEVNVENVANVTTENSDSTNFEIKDDGRDVLGGDVKHQDMAIAPVAGCSSESCEHSVINSSLNEGPNMTSTELSDVVSKKSVEQSENKTKKKKKQTSRAKLKNVSAYRVTKLRENFFSCHEYLLLPRFKFDKYSRLERNSGYSHLKPIGQEEFFFRLKSFGEPDLQQLCGLIFVENTSTAKVLFYLLNDLKHCDEDFSFLNVQFTIDRVFDGNKDPNDAETEHRKQELVLKKFRTKECNLLIGTSFLEEGIDLPKCNLVVRFNTPKDYRSYVRSKERARAQNSLFCLLADVNEREVFITKLAEYFEVERVLLNNCMNLEPPPEEEEEAEQYVNLIQPFCPLMKPNTPYIDLSTAIAYVNRYCAKLPSDTFTCLTPLWEIKPIDMYDRQMYVCNIRLPINSPMKQEIKGYPMPTAVLARRFAAFQCCQLLHFEGELDDSLQPISKETFWLREEEQLLSGSDERDEILSKDNNEPRPGTTKRRQYYYKRIADSLTDCRPTPGKTSFLYDISMALTYPLPEEQNTRGRKIHAPEDSFQGFGILTSKIIPQIGAFPIFTRSGEVQVKLQLAQSTVSLSETQTEKIVDFIHYTFTSVLRLQRYLTMFDPSASENSYFIVPTKRVSDVVEVDWDFLELIYEKKNQVPVFIPDHERKDFIFDPKQFEDAVITPWYRNQDQPQYFYVAEICYNLSPKSSFPGSEYNTFEEYYYKKYEIKIQNSSQALLDVDHTSARLNFLTPRYVNRKGVALPTTSEEKKKAKRENLEQKQILIPELCNIHPFPGTLWRKAVCLPCILHRVNALLLADQLRRTVANEIGVGMTELDSDFNWKPLDFGWSLSDVLTSKNSHPKREEKDKDSGVKNKAEAVSPKENTKAKEIKSEEEETEILPLMEIGTWSNEMAENHFVNNSYLDESNNYCNTLVPHSFAMLDDSRGRNYLPSRWNDPRILGDEMSDFSSGDSCSDDYLSQGNNDSDSDCGGLRIEFKEDNVAEAIESNKNHNISNLDSIEEYEKDPWLYDDAGDEEYRKYVGHFETNVEINKEKILKNDILYEKEKEFDLVLRSSKSFNHNTESETEYDAEATFGNPDNTFPQLIEDIPESLINLPHTEIIIKSLNDQKQRKPNGLNVDEPIINMPPNLSCDEFKNDICPAFSFDYQPDLNNHPGPSPSLILQALTMSNANDGINLERLETIGDSFLKYAITAYLYCTYENVHEGKLSHLRSKQVSNYSLYRLGHKKVLGENMIATKFEPHDNWLPPCYYIPREFERALIRTGLPPSHWNRADLPVLKNLTDEEICQLVKEKGEKLGVLHSGAGSHSTSSSHANPDNARCFIPYNLMTQHSIPDKSIADCVEALIGAYLVACGPRGALLFMSWLGIKVLPKEEKFYKSEDQIPKHRPVGTTHPVKIMQDNEEVWHQVTYGALKSPKPPLLRHVPDPEGDLERLLRGFDTFETNIQYRFRDRSYLLQALTHASYSSNRLTDCYQRLEFLGDAVLDYLITRHLYEDPRHHSPGALTDLRSALVNNTIFASLAVRHDFHKYFRHFCPGLNEVFDRFVRIQEENGHSINEEFYLVEEEEFEEVEDVEVPKALGDIFESIAGAIFLDSGMSLDEVWRVYYRIMKKEIELFSTNVPKSPIRELFELEPETAQFGKPEKLADGKRVRVTVEVFGKGLFNGIGRNYRIAKCTAAKCALKKLKGKDSGDRGK